MAALDYCMSVIKKMSSVTRAYLVFGLLIIVGLWLYRLIYYLGVDLAVTEGYYELIRPNPGPAKGQGPRNSTLGFQKIFYINLPERSERRDMMGLMSGYLNLDFEMRAGVDGQSIVDKAMPYDVRNATIQNGITRSQVGCWRSHANVWSHIVSSDISSALIFEDDADFSIGIRDILERISIQLQEVEGARNGEPYGLVDGNSWDVIALGICYHEGPDPEKNPKAAQMSRGWFDPYAPESDHLSEKYLPGGSKRVRVLTLAKGMACTHAYAVSRAGAMRLLYNVGGPGHELDRPVDLLMGDLMGEGRLKGYSIIPTVVGQWSPGDWRSSDIDEGPKWGTGSWKEVIQSVRSEMAEVWGNRNVWDEYEHELENTTDD